MVSTGESDQFIVLGEITCEYAHNSRVMVNDGE